MRRQIKPFTIERKRGARTAGAESPMLDLTPPPAPKPNAPQMPQTGRFAAAEALFAAPPPPVASARPEKAAITGRILPSLVEPPAPVYAEIADEPPRRRGRKPGSRNKVRTPVQGADVQPFDPQDAGAHGPKTIHNVMRNLFDFWAAEDEQGAPSTDAPVTTSAAPLELRRRARIARDELPRGQRWKARLPRFAR